MLALLRDASMAPGRSTMQKDVLLTPRQRFQADVDDLRSLFGNKYDRGIDEALEYANTLEWFV